MVLRSIHVATDYDPQKLSGGSGLSKAFPALDDPSYTSAANATHTRPDDEVLGVVYEGKARVYPTWATYNYHIVNDRWDNSPLLIDT